MKIEKIIKRLTKIKESFLDINEFLAGLRKIIYYFNRKKNDNTLISEEVLELLNNISLLNDGIQAEISNIYSISSNKTKNQNADPYKTHIRLILKRGVSINQILDLISALKRNAVIEDVSVFLELPQLMEQSAETDPNLTLGSDPFSASKVH